MRFSESMASNLKMPHDFWIPKYAHIWHKHASSIPIYKAFHSRKHGKANLYFLEKVLPHGPAFFPPYYKKLIAHQHETLLNTVSALLVETVACDDFWILTHSSSLNYSYPRHPLDVQSVVMVAVQTVYHCQRTAKQQKGSQKSPLWKLGVAQKRRGCPRACNLLLGAPQLARIFHMMAQR